MALFKNDKNENKNQISWRKITTRPYETEKKKLYKKFNQKLKRMIKTIKDT